MLKSTMQSQLFKDMSKQFISSPLIDLVVSRNQILYGMFAKNNFKFTAGTVEKPIDIDFMVSPGKQVPLTESEMKFQFDTKIVRKNPLTNLITQACYESFSVSGLTKELYYSIELKENEFTEFKFLILSPYDPSASDLGISKNGKGLKYFYELVEEVCKDKKDDLKVQNVSSSLF